MQILILLFFPYPCLCRWHVWTGISSSSVCGYLTHKWALILGIREKQPSSCFCSHKIINGFNLLSEKCNLWITLLKIKSPLQFTSQKLLIVFSTNVCHWTSGIHHCFPFLSTVIFYPICWRFLSSVWINYGCTSVRVVESLQTARKRKEKEVDLEKVSDPLFLPSPCTQTVLERIPRQRDTLAIEERWNGFQK